MKPALPARPPGAAAGHQHYQDRTASVIANAARDQRIVDPGDLMTAPVAASERDLRALAAIVSEDRPDLEKEGLPPSLLADLMGQIRCDVVSFEGSDSGRQTLWFWQVIPTVDIPGREDLDRAHWEHYWECKPCSYADRTGDLRSVLKVSDFYSARQWHSTRMYCDYYRPFGMEHELQLCLPEAPGPTVAPGRTVRLYFGRGPGPDFSERDRALLTLLRPHLHQAYLDAERCRRVPQLTPRHWELLRLLAGGHTNIQIARRLGISAGTVRAHLQTIYARLNVSNRTAAVTRAFPDGLVPGPGLSRPSPPSNPSGAEPHTSTSPGGVGGAGRIGGRSAG